MINRNLVNNNYDDDNIEEKLNSNRKRNVKEPVTTKNKVVMIIWILVAVFVYYQITMLALYTIGKVDKDKMWLYNGVNGVVNFIVGGTNKLTTEDYNAKLAGLGDIYITANTLKGAKNGNDYDFSNGIDKVSNILKDYDFVIGSLNTPIADKSLGYTVKNEYNAPASLTDTLKKLNISALATAGNHVMDKNTKGIQNTIDNLKSANIEQVGIGVDARSKPVIMEKNQIKIGVLSYATKSNVKYKDENLLNVLDDENLKEDMEYLKTQEVDFIVAYLNVPDEDALLVNDIQKQGTEKLFNAGVNIVLGTGAMVIQDDDEDEITIGDQKSHVYTIYSLGDFMGSYETTDNKISVIANLEFTKSVTKNKKGEVTKTEKDIKVKQPIGVYTAIDKDYKKNLYIINDEIEAYNQDKSQITSKDYQNMKNAQSRITTLYQ